MILLLNFSIGPKGDNLWLLAYGHHYWYLKSEVQHLNLFFNIQRRLIDEMNFHSENIIPRNVISKNNFLGHNILGIFGMQIKFSRIFDKFPKISLMEVEVGGFG